jgi:hypothetical protein
MGVSHTHEIGIRLHAGNYTCVVVAYALHGLGLREIVALTVLQVLH